MPVFIFGINSFFCGMNLIEILSGPWPWYVSGPILGLTVPILLLIGNKSFGISSNLRHICAICVPGEIDFFNYDWKKEAWNLFFVFGILAGAFFGGFILENTENVEVNNSIKEELQALGITSFNFLNPIEVFSWPALFSFNGLIFIVLGGFFVGFGTRYAGGCTSGHSIFGLSTLQWPSLVATLSFMVGGLLASNFLIPLLW